MDTEGRGPVVAGKGVGLLIAATKAFPSNAALQTQSLFTLRNLTLTLSGTRVRVLDVCVSV